MHALLLHALVAFIPSYERTWSYLFGQVVAGLTLGSLYALLALGYTLVYGILKLLNFAHGDVYMIGSYIGYFVLTALGGSASPVVPTAAPAPGDVRRLRCSARVCSGSRSSASPTGRSAARRGSHR